MFSIAHSKFELKLLPLFFALYPAEKFVSRSDDFCSAQSLPPDPLLSKPTRATRQVYLIIETCLLKQVNNCQNLESAGRFGGWPGDRAVVGEPCTDREAVVHLHILPQPRRAAEAL